MASCGGQHCHRMPYAFINWETQRGRRLAEMLHGLDPTDAQAVAPPQPSEGTPLRLVDIRRIAPPTRMNQALIAHSYRWERIPEEHYPTWQLDPSNPEHRDLLVAQKVQRKGPGN